MIGSEQLTNRKCGTEEAEQWRRQLINRLADVQVALWVTEASPESEQGDDKCNSAEEDNEQPVISPEDIFVGLSRNAGTQASEDGIASTAPIGDQFTPWDKLDEKRQLLELVEKLSRESSNSFRSKIAMICIASLSGLALLSYGAVEVLSQANFKEAPSLPGHTDTYTSGHEIGIATFAAGGKEAFKSEPLLRASLPHSVDAPKNPAANDIAELLANDHNDLAADDTVAAFAQVRQVNQTAPVVALEVSREGRAKLPLRLLGASASALDTTMVLLELPPSIMPTIGTRLSDTVWRFRLSDVEYQNLRFNSSSSTSFVLRYATTNGGDSLLSIGSVHIEAHKPGNSIAKKGAREAPPAIEASNSAQAPIRRKKQAMAEDEPTKRRRDEPEPKSVRRRTPPPDDGQQMGLGAAAVKLGDKTRPQPRRREKEERSGGWNFQSQPQPSWSPFLRP